MKKIVLVGGGGHCKSVISALKSNEIVYDEIGIIDCREKIGQQICGINIIGEDDDLENLYGQGFSDAFISLGSIGNPSRRKSLLDKVRKIGYNIPNIIDSSSVIAEDVILKDGIFVGKGSIINNGTFIGAGSIINTAAIIEHDCSIKEYVHVAPGSLLCGEVKVYDEVHIGANATVIQGITIGYGAIIGAGSVIIKDVSDGSKVVGNPGRVLF